MSRARRRGVVAAASFLVLCGRNKKRRSYWVRSFLQSRAIYSLEDLLADLRRDDTDQGTEEATHHMWFKNFTRISSEDFAMLIEKISPFVKKQDTNFRKAISVVEQLKNLACHT